MGNIKMDLGDIGWYGMDWVHVTQDRDQQWRALVNTELNFGFHRMLESS
jgi:hypothetical protein